MKNLITTSIFMAILGASIIFEFDPFRVYAAFAFILALDCQVVLAIKHMQEKKIMETILQHTEENKGEKDENSK